MAEALLIVLVFGVSTTFAGDPVRTLVHMPGADADARASWEQFASEHPVQVRLGELPSDPGGLGEVDVVVLREAIDGGQRRALEPFLAAGGGVVVLSPEVIQDDPAWWLEHVGGGWSDDADDHRDELQGLYFQDNDHPITRGASNFDLPDQKIWFNHQVSDAAHVLAVSYHTLEIFAPQMWTWTGDEYRAFAWLQGHREDVTEAAHLKVLLLRGITWAAGHDTMPEVSEAERLALFYPPHGPVHPDEAADYLEIEPGFDVELVAAEPDVVNPISIDWDPQGRLWIAQTPEYPYKHEDDRPGRDKITIHSDTTGDGWLDEARVFAEDFELITSLLLHEDGVLVLQPPNLYHVRDTTGDGKADTRETILTGFGRADTHASSSNMVWGFDGWVYATMGYSRGHLRSGDGEKDFGSFAEGVIRFKPDGSAAQQVSRKGGNTWGIDVDQIGELFWSQATSGRHLFHIVMPEYVLQRGRVDEAPAWHSLFDHFMELYPAMRDDRPAYVQVAPTGGITAVAGSTVYTGGAWPEQFDRFHFISEPTYWLSHVGIIEPDGITYEGRRHREEVEFLAGRDLWYCPIHHRVGPDGAMYIVDFYNQAVSHNDIRMPGELHGPGNAAVRPDRDQSMGRIFRVQHEDAVHFDRPSLDEAGPAELVEALAHPNQWFRMTAQRLLSEGKPGDAVSPLVAMVESHDSHLARLHALWTLEHMGELDDAVLIAAMEDGHYGVRRNAMHLAGERDAVGEPVIGAIGERLDDDDLRVRLLAMIALQSTEPGEATRELAVATFTEGDVDRYRRSAAMGVLGRTPGESIEALASSGAAPGDLRSAMEQLVGRLIGAGDGEAVGSLVRWLGEADEVPASLKTTVLGALADSEDTPAPRWDQALAEAMGALGDPDAPNLAAISVTLATRWAPEGELAMDVDGVVEQLSDRLASEEASAEDRADAAHVLVQLPQSRDGALELILEVLPTAEPTTLAPRLLEMLGGVEDASVGAALVDILPALAPEAQGKALDELIRRGSWTKKLLAAIEAGDVPLSTVGPTHRHLLRQHPDEDVAASARQVMAQASVGTEEVRQLIEHVASQPAGAGDPEMGEMIFQACITCHTYEGRGVAVGPDITGIGSHDAGYLLGIIVDSSFRTPGAQYTAYNVRTRDGQAHVGLIAEQDAEGLTLRQAGGAERRIARENIASLESTGQSLMPDFSGLGEEGLLNLLAYLRGDSRYRVINLTDAYTADSTSGMWSSESNPDDSLQFETFGVTRVDGVPFDIAHPGRSDDGQNVIVLKGGSGAAARRPQEVAFEVGFAARRLHILGGVAAWGYPYGSEDGHNVPVVQVTVHYADGQSEEHVLRNGEHYSDWIRRIDVPGSTYAPDLTARGQLRVIELGLEHEAEIDRIEMRSYDNHVAPAVVAITAEVGTD